MKNYLVKNLDGGTLDVDDVSRRVKVALNRVDIEDHDKEIIDAGAFLKTIAERGPTGKNLVWHLTDHNASPSALIAILNFSISLVSVVFFTASLKSFIDSLSDPIETLPSACNLSSSAFTCFMPATLSLTSAPIFINSPSVGIRVNFSCYLKNDL